MRRMMLVLAVLVGFGAAASSAGTTKVLELVDAYSTNGPPEFNFLMPGEALELWQETTRLTFTGPRTLVTCEGGHTRLGGEDVTNNEPIDTISFTTVNIGGGRCDEGYEGVSVSGETLSLALTVGGEATLEGLLTVEFLNGCQYETHRMRSPFLPGATEDEKHSIAVEFSSKLKPMPGMPKACPKKLTVSQLGHFLERRPTSYIYGNVVKR